MGLRLLSAVVGIILLIAVLLSGKLILNIALAAIIIMALYEIYRPFGFIRRSPLAIIGFSLAIALSFGELTNAKFILFLICAYIIIMLIMAVLYHKTTRFKDIAILLFTTLYIALMLIHIKLIRIADNGQYLIYAVFIGAFSSDTGAYFTGMFFGKNKLIPDISPKKTVEGAAGGVICTVISFIIYGLILVFFFELNVNWINILIISVISSIAAQFGDLAASMIKRELNIKDYGGIFPGHGGILDRFDSVIFVAPVIYYLLIYLPIIV